MIKVGDKVRFIGKDSVAYEKGKVYEVTAYDADMNAYGVMSELGEDYYVSADYLEELPKQ